MIADRAFIGRGPEGDLVLHLEFEAEPTSDAGERVARTACGLHFGLRLPVRTTIVYLHPARNARRPKRRYRLGIGEQALDVAFRVLVVWEDLNAEEIVAEASPGLLPFAGLAKGASLDIVRRAARAINGLALTGFERVELQTALYFLSGYHFTPTELLAIMNEEALMQSKTYTHTVEKNREKYHEEGREEGFQSLLLSMLRAEFGEVGPDVEARVRGATEAQVQAWAIRVRNARALEDVFATA